MDFENSIKSSSYFQWDCKLVENKGLLDFLLLLGTWSVVDVQRQSLCRDIYI